MIHANFRIPSCDYEQLLKVTEILTKKRKDIAQNFRRMLFNIASHNRDDHVKNFAFRFAHEEESWHVAPAFDLTYSMGPGGEHSMTVNGEGRTPRKEDVMALAQKVSISPKKAQEIIEEVCEGVSHWTTLANEAGVPKRRIKEVAQRIEENIRHLQG